MLEYIKHRKDRYKDRSYNSLRIKETICDHIFSFHVTFVWSEDSFESFKGFLSVEHCYWFAFDGGCWFGFIVWDALLATKIHKIFFRINFFILSFTFYLFNNISIIFLMTRFPSRRRFLKEALISVFFEPDVFMIWEVVRAGIFMTGLDEVMNESVDDCEDLEYHEHYRYNNNFNIELTINKTINFNRKPKERGHNPPLLIIRANSNLHNKDHNNSERKRDLTENPRFKFIWFSYCNGRRMRRLYPRDWEY